jgi:hypothetical protein
VKRRRGLTVAGLWQLSRRDVDEWETVKKLQATPRTGVQ